MRSPGHPTGSPRWRRLAVASGVMALGWLAFAATSLAAPSPGLGAEAAARLPVTEVGPSDPTPTPLGTLNLTRVTDPECCALVGWAADSQAVLVLTQPASAQVVQVQAIPVAGGKAELAWKRPASFSLDGSLAVEQETDSVRITKRSSGASWAIANAGRELRFSPDGTRIAWDIVSSGITHPDVREHSVWVAEVSGARPRKLATTIGGGLVGWTAGGQALIVTGRIQANGQEGIWSIGLDASEPRLIHRAYRPRDPLISPGGEWIAFHIAFTGDAGQNGLWIVRTDGSALSKITPFGAYRWRSDDRLLLIPLTTQEAPALFEVDASAGRAVQLTDPRLTSLPIANGEWIVSPDGSRLAFTSWADRAIWVLQLPD